MQSLNKIIKTLDFNATETIPRISSIKKQKQIPVILLDLNIKDNWLINKLSWKRIYLNHMYVARRAR